MLSLLRGNKYVKTRLEIQAALKESVERAVIMHKRASIEKEKMRPSDASELLEPRATDDAE